MLLDSFLASKPIINNLQELEVIEERLNYKFKNRLFLSEALTHTSFTGDQADCYQVWTKEKWRMKKKQEKEEGTENANRKRKKKKKKKDKKKHRRVKKK